jgi:hypothetical protein
MCDHQVGDAGMHADDAAALRHRAQQPDPGLNLALVGGRQQQHIQRLLGAAAPGSRRPLRARAARSFLLCTNTTGMSV